MFGRSWVHVPCLTLLYFVLSRRLSRYRVAIGVAADRLTADTKIAKVKFDSSAPCGYIKDLFQRTVICNLKIASGSSKKETFITCS